MKCLYFLGMFLILLASCSEPNNPGDPPPTGGDTCHYFLNDAINNIMAQWVYPTYLLQTVSINPNNADEFAYVQKHVANNTVELHKCGNGDLADQFILLIENWYWLTLQHLIH